MKNAYNILSIPRGRNVTDELVKERYEGKIKFIDITEQGYKQKKQLDSALRDEQENIITIMVGKKKEPLTYRKMLEQQRQEAVLAYEQIKDEESRKKYDELLKKEEQQKKEKAKQPQVASSQKITKLSNRYNQVVRGPNVEAINKSVSEKGAKPVTTAKQQKQTLDVPTVRGGNIRWNKAKWEEQIKNNGETLDAPTIRGRNIKWDKTRKELKREDGEAR